MATIRRFVAWLRRIHALLGVVSALNLLLLISTGLLLQHEALLGLDQHIVSRRLLPSNYRPQDGEAGTRADIVVTDLHSGRILGPVGTLILDVVTLAWLVMLGTGLVMYFLKRARTARAKANGSANGGQSHEAAESSAV